jgi:glycosyltransferase involved in cell wall biosynthesis
MGGFKLLFLPLWIDDNPYQKLLIEQLSHLGVQIETGDIFTLALLERHQPDIIHLHWLDPYFIGSNTLDSWVKSFKFLIKLVFLRWRGTKIVWTAHNLKNHEGRNAISGWVCTALVARIAHAIVAHCESAKHEIATALHLNQKDKIFVVPHGNYIDFYANTIDRTEARQELNLSESSLVLLFLGLLRPYKGVLELIESFKQLPQDKVELLIAGKAINDEFVQLIQQQVKGQENIRLMAGFVPEERIQVYMNACDVVVFPYREILTSGAVLLAMSFSRACIAPRKGCMAEVLDDLGAFLYEPDLEAGLSKAMCQAIQSQAALDKMGDRNRQLAEKYNWQQIAKMTLDVYQRCLS